MWLLFISRTKKTTKENKKERKKERKEEKNAKMLTTSSTRLRL